MQTLNDFYSLAKPFLEEPEVKLDEEEKNIAKILEDELSKTENWNEENILKAIKNVLEKENIKMPIIYKILTGEKQGLPLPQSLQIFGKEKTIKRIENVK